MKKNRNKIKTNFVTHKKYVGKSDEWLNWAASARFYILRKLPMEMIRFPVHMVVSTYLQNERHRPDLSNTYQGPEDLLQACGVIKNDQQVKSHDGSRIYVVKDEPERVEIKIYRFLD